MKKRTSGTSKEEMKMTVMKMARKDNYQKIFQHLCSEATKDEKGKSQAKIHQTREMFARMIEKQAEHIKNENDIWDGPIGQMMILAYEKAHNSDL